MLNDRLNQLGDYPFRRLAGLLAPVVPPEGVPPIVMTAGDPRMGSPALVAELIQANAALWGTYPPSAGTPEFRAAVAGWCGRRYGLPAGMVDPDRHVVPVPGTREGLFMLALATVPQERRGQRPLVCMPNPLYHVYGAAAAIAGAEPYFLDTPRETGFLPDLDALDADTLARTALFYLCTPSNPQGAVADLAYLTRLVELAREYGFVLGLDECYAEIYDRAAPAGGLQACAALGGSLDHVVVFHSLSKRSSSPGLRSGFACGDADAVAGLLRLAEYGGAGMPGPIMATATALWADEAHVEPVRAFYRQNIDVAERILGNRFGFYRPPGGFFLWLDVGDGEAATVKLWRDAGVRVLPGKYMTRGPEPTPSDPFIRVALVHPPEITARGLSRLAEIL